jgi:hypothetical protein
MIFPSLNVGILAIFYTLLGGVLSYVSHFLFDEFDDSWKSKSTLYKIYDVTVEVVLIGLVAFWTMFYIKDSPPIFNVSRSMDSLVDTYISGIFFSFSIFLFFGDLESKIRYLYKQTVDSTVKTYFPTKGSILDGTLTFESRKTDNVKSSSVEHYGL